MLGAAELRFLDLLIPWDFGIIAAGLLLAYAVVYVMEKTGLTRHIWYIALFFCALAVLFGSIVGLLFHP